MEVPGPGVESELWLQPLPQPQQQQIWAASGTYTASCDNARSSTYWARPGTEPASSQRQHQVLYSLSHNKNFSSPFLNIWLQEFWTIYFQYIEISFCIWTVQDHRFKILIDTPCYSSLWVRMKSIFFLSFSPFLLPSLPPSISTSFFFCLPVSPFLFKLNLFITGSS